MKWGFEFADGRRVTNVDRWPEQPNQDHSRPQHPDDWRWEPDHPVLRGGRGGGGSRAVDRDYWLWPLPPAGPLRVVCQWPGQDIDVQMHDLDATPFRDAAGRAQPAWPSATTAAADWQSTTCRQSRLCDLPQPRSTSRSGHARRTQHEANRRS